MTKLYNQALLTNTRKKLRANMPETEKRLWFYLRAKQLRGVKFRRQYSIGNYIIDFYAPSKRLAIEIDGESHYTKNQQRLDAIRDEKLFILNICVLRFTNDEIMKNIDAVIETIHNKCN
jgi:very-short-patch-repair endonuclease